MLHLRTVAADRVMRPAIDNCLGAIPLVVGHHDGGSSRCHITVCISQTERDCINASIASASALRSQLNRLAIGCDLDVVDGITVTAAARVVQFVACYLTDYDITDANASAIIKHRGNK